MDFDLPEELADLQATVRRLAQDKVKPRAREIDETGEYPQDLFELFRDAGLLGLCIPDGVRRLGRRHPRPDHRHRGGGQVLEHGRADAAADPAAHRAGDDRRQRGAEAAVPARHRRRRRSACGFGLSEPQAGSDVMGMRTKAVRDGDGWVLNGTKCWMSGVVQADWYTVFAKTADDVTSRKHDSITAFIVDRSLDGVEVGTHRPQDGRAGRRHRRAAARTTCGCPPTNVIGEVGGFRLAMLGLNSMRPIVAARGIGLAEGALMYATEYVQQREAFGKTIADFQGIQWEIAKLATEIEAARLLTYRAAWMADRGQFTKEWVPYLSMAKYYATELAVRASNLALQMLGAAGYMKDHLTELYYRDAKQLTIVEGTTQVQLGLIGRGVLDRDLWWD